MSMTKTLTFMLAALVMGLASGCDLPATSDDQQSVALRYQASSPTPEDRIPVEIAGNVADATARVAESLRNAGFTILDSDPLEGVIDAQISDNRLVNCGNYRAGPAGEVSAFAVNNPNAVVEVPRAEGGTSFARHLFAANSRVRITLWSSNSSSMTEVSVSENHTVSLQLITLTDGATLFSESRTFRGSITTAFGNGVICGSARAIRPLIRRS